MELKEISQKSAKKDIWDAYQAILQEMAERQKAGQALGAADGAQPSLLEIEEKKILTQAAGQGSDKVIGDIGGLKININNVLNRLADRLVEELKKEGI